MILDARGIIIDNRPERAAELKQRLGSVITFSDYLSVRSPREGMEVLAEQYFEVCFISAEFTSEDVNSLLFDLSRLKQESPVVVVQVRDDLRANEVREDLAGSRFATVITRHITEQDSVALLRVLNQLVQKREVKRRCQESYVMMDLALREIDRVAKDIKRGKKRKLTRSAFVSSLQECIEFNPAVLESYFDQLEKQLEKSVPAKDVTVIIPQRLFDLDLPGLSNGTYEGQSLRVWEMLAQKFGVPKGSQF
jgi:hypothetical protein